MNRAIKFYKENPTKFHELYERRFHNILRLLDFLKISHSEIYGIEMAVICPPSFMGLEGWRRACIYIRSMHNDILSGQNEYRRWVKFLKEGGKMEELYTIDTLLVFHHLRHMTILNPDHKKRFKGFKQTQDDVIWPNVDYFFVDYGKQRPIDYYDKLHPII